MYPVGPFRIQNQPAVEAYLLTVNLTAYTKMKQFLQDRQPAYADKELPGYQTAGIGLIAGSMGPISNAPIDTISTCISPFNSAFSAMSTYLQKRTYKRPRRNQAKVGCPTSQP